MTAYDFDFLVVGGGSGGVRAARMAAGLGAKVAVAEEANMGGTCVNVGCIPKKLLVYAAHFQSDFEDAQGYGWNVGPTTFDWSRLIANKDREIRRLNGIYSGMLERAGVQVFPGRATVQDPHTVEVAGKRLSARYLLIAVGGWPRRPSWPGAELGITSNEVFSLPEMPKRLLICGGGYIAVELAGVFHGLGSQVTQLYRRDLFLRGFDDDLRKGLRDEMLEQGVDLRFGCNISRIDGSPGNLTATLNDESKLACDQVLLAIGRSPKTKGLGLERAGVALDERGAVLVDDYGKTSTDSIYAVGDVTGRIELTPIALAEGSAVATTLFGHGPSTPDHELVPSAIFSHPTIGTVGLSESDARAKYPDDIEIYRSQFRPLKHTLTGRKEHCITKLVVQKSSQRVLGLHMLGDQAGEIVQGFAVALKMGATKAQLDATIGIHPTSAEELVTMRTPIA